VLEVVELGKAALLHPALLHRHGYANTHSGVSENQDTIGAIADLQAITQRYQKDLRYNRELARITVKSAKHGGKSLYAVTDQPLSQDRYNQSESILTLTGIHGHAPNSEGEFVTFMTKVAAVLAHCSIKATNSTPADTCDGCNDVKNRLLIGCTRFTSMFEGSCTSCVVEGTPCVKNAGGQPICEGEGGKGARR
jgi:hypothetical protein